MVEDDYAPIYVSISAGWSVLQDTHCLFPLSTTESLEPYRRVRSVLSKVLN